jgi:predicted nucleic acid-binding protein
MRSGSNVPTGELVDSNVFVYAADSAAGERNTRSLALIQDLKDRGDLVVSTQVLHEVYVAITRPNRPPSLPHPKAEALVRDIADAATVLPLTRIVTFRALRGVARHRMSLWDALIWATALENGIAVVHTEDIQSAPEIDGVRYRNPFEGLP